MSESMCKRPNVHPHNATGNLFAFFVSDRNYMNNFSPDWPIGLKCLEHSARFASTWHFFDSLNEFSHPLSHFCSEAEGLIYYIKYGS